MQTPTKRSVTYYYDDTVGTYYYQELHTMKPFRMRMTHALIQSYGLYKKLYTYRPGRPTATDLTKFHTDEYIQFLERVRPQTKYTVQMRRFNVGQDCPIFDGLFELCQISAGGSIAAATHLNAIRSEICINWSGGMHHAKKEEASGFCYVNDIVLGILELLKAHRRVLYIDIDVHHGDGVEEAFYTTDRVMTLNFHQHGNFFPGTGNILDIGADRGKHYALNIPLLEGIDDDSYQSMFTPIVCKTMETYRPEVVVLQCGADSLSGDRLGKMNLTEKGHGKCVELLRGFNVPLLMLGGGGYTLCNVARCWTYETAIAVGADISDDLPYNDFLEYYGPTYTLHIDPQNAENMNSKRYLEKIKTRAMENLRMIPHAPGVQMQIMPDSFFDSDDDDEDATNKDERVLQSNKDSRISPNNEFYNSDSSEDDNACNENARRSIYKLSKTILTDAPLASKATQLDAHRQNCSAESKRGEDGTPTQLVHRLQTPLNGMEIMVVAPQGHKNPKIEQKYTQIEVVQPTDNSVNNKFHSFDFAGGEKAEISINKSSTTLKVDAPTTISEATRVEATQIKEVRPIDENTKKNAHQLAVDVFVVSKKLKTDDQAPENDAQNENTYGGWIYVRRNSRRSTRKDNDY